MWIRWLRRQHRQSSCSASPATGRHLSWWSYLLLQPGRLTIIEGKASKDQHCVENTKNTWYSASATDMTCFHYMFPKSVKTIKHRNNQSTEIQGQHPKITNASVSKKHVGAKCWHTRWAGFETCPLKTNWKEPDHVANIVAKKASCLDVCDIWL